LRVLGFGRSVPIGPLDRLFPIMWFGFIVSALSGLALLVTDPVTRLHQTVFYVKLIFVALAVVNMQMMRSRIFRGPAVSDGVLPSNARTLAMASLVLWIGATTAGRLIAYI
jgi:multisubunit Na+/H+ antiporter MnhF subunit